MISDGHELWTVKKLLRRGEFGKWRRASFPGDRTPQNLMAVAKWLGTQNATVAYSRLCPTACYRLVARWVPAEARQQALERANTGETITTVLAEEIIAAICDQLGLPAMAPWLTRPRNSLKSAMGKCGRHCTSKEFHLSAEKTRDLFNSFISAQTNGKGRKR